MWVPFELGAAYVQDKGIGTFVRMYIEIPEYLHEFPILKNESDLNKYIEQYLIDTNLAKIFIEKGLLKEVEASRKSTSGAQEFINDLKSALGQ